MSIGKSVRLFLADGTPGGLLTAEIMNWTGHLVAAPRSELASLIKRPEVGRTGIYILLGDDPEATGGALAYIGEGDNVSKRLYQHSRPESQGGKDFWDRAVVLTSKDSNLTKAHARYLESRLITLAQEANRSQLVNGTAPMPIALPESDVSDTEYFISQAKIALPVLGVNLFRSTNLLSQKLAQPHSSQLEHASASPIFEMRLKAHGVCASAQEVDGEFTILKDSTARRDWTGIAGGYENLRTRLEQDGAIGKNLNKKIAYFTKNQVFASPSAAAAVVAGRSANGRTSWIAPSTGLTFGDWQNQGTELAE